jgi:RNA polymerase sigma factor (sigma-70 family)
MANMLSANRRGASFVELHAAAADGQRWAADALTDEFLPRLVSFAKMRGAADPEGIAHVALVSVLRRLGELNFAAKEQMWAYLCQTARSRIIDEFRAAKPVDLLEDHSALQELGGDRRAALVPFDDRIVNRDYVDELLSPLTNEQRQVLEMRFFDDLSIEETASRTGRSQDAVKGLQRRAINAIIAAAAIILALVALRWADGGPDQPTSNAPADQTDIIEDDPLPAAEDKFGDGDAAGGAALVVDGVDVDKTTTGTEEADNGAEAASNTDSAPGADLDRFTVTVGSDRATPLDMSGATVPSSAHGTRVYCPVSHFSYGDPINGQRGLATLAATMFWGNTSADAASVPAELPNVGNSSCEGGINDRSAYWMPALFDRDGQVVLPELVLVEYKTFGGPTLERSNVQPIPPGLQLVADATVPNGGDTFGTSGGDESVTSFVIAFPECVMTDSAGLPVLSSEDNVAHLTHDGAPTPTGCPSSHPYRIPQVTFKVDFAVPYNSGWYLSTGYDAQSAPDELSAGLVSGWDQASMDGLVRCTIELIGNCEFAAVADGRKTSRSQLPERLLGPDGTEIYRGSVQLSDQADRTPFGASVPQFS